MARSPRAPDGDGNRRVLAKICGIWKLESSLKMIYSNNKDRRIASITETNFNLNIFNWEIFTSSSANNAR